MIVELKTLHKLPGTKALLLNFGAHAFITGVWSSICVHLFHLRIVRLILVSLRRSFARAYRLKARDSCGDVFGFFSYQLMTANRGALATKARAFERLEQ